MSTPLRVLVWQWGRRGAGPRFAVELATGLAGVANTTVFLSLSSQAELLQGAGAPASDLLFDTYIGWTGFVRRLASLPFALPALMRKIKALRPDIAICAMPGPIDLLMAAALRGLGIPFLVMIHDADAHPGDGLPLQMTLQRLLTRQAHALVTLSTHVAERLRIRGDIRGRPLLTASHPPFVFGAPPPPPRTHGGPLRLLVFGRLLPYKGLDLLAGALRLLGPNASIETRIAGQGPESETLATLRALPHVTVENRWIAETEIAGLLAWSDALVLSHREASQSGVAAVAIAANRWLVATDVGGLTEQLRNEPLARLCKPTAEGLAEAIKSLLSDPPEPGAVPVAPRAEWTRVAQSLAHEMRIVLGR